MNQLNYDLRNVTLWLQINKLKLNLNKTKFMNIGNKKIVNTPIIMMDGEILEEVFEIKYLGVIIDHQLTMSLNTRNVVKKIAKKVSLLGRIRRFINSDSCKTIYNTIIVPDINYCSSILFLAKEEDFKKLTVLQNKAMRIILRRNKYSKISIMLRDLNILSFKQIVHLNVIVFLFKIFKGKQSSELLRKIYKHQNTHNHMTRRKNEIRLPFRKTSKSQNSLLYRAVRIFQEIPTNIREEENSLKFRKEVYKYVKCHF